MSRRLACSLALAFIASVCAQAGAANGEPANGQDARIVIERVDAAARAELAKDGIGSVTVGVVERGKLAWSKSYGFADVEKKIPASAETIYRIGSITKQFTALMLLQLVERGRVHLSDPAQAYYPEINAVQGRYPGAPPITLFQLATHTSGLDRDISDAKYLRGPLSSWDKTLDSALPHMRYAYEPGTRYSYSNVGYAVLGAALGHAAKQSYVDYIRQNVLAPLGMSNTFFEVAEGQSGRVAKGYSVEAGKIDFTLSESDQKNGRGYRVPNGALYTTVGDLAKFMGHEMGFGPPSVLKKQSIEANWMRAVVSDGAFDKGYGVGFMIERIGDTTLYGHSGLVSGYQAQAFFDRQSKLGVIVLSNTKGSAFDGFNILNAAFQPR